MPTIKTSINFYLFLLIIISFLIFLFLGYLGEKDIFTAFNIWVSQSLQGFASPYLTLFMQSVSILEFVAPFILLVLLIIFHLRKRYAETIFLILSTGYLIPRLVKDLYHLGCPAEPSVHKWWVLHLPYQGPLAILQTDYCFPSGHVFSYVTFFGFLLFLIIKFAKKARWRDFWIIFLVLTLILIGPSRVYLGAHWTMDVVGGYLLGFSYLLLCILFYQNRTQILRWLRLRSKT